jgi:hypothetical protein
LPRTAAQTLFLEPGTNAAEVFGMGYIAAGSKMLSPSRRCAEMDGGPGVAVWAADWKTVDVVSGQDPKANGRRRSTDADAVDRRERGVDTAP